MKGITQATADFIRAHADDDVRQLALKGTKSPDIDLTFALDQIAGHQTARRKLPTWAASGGIVFPPHLSMEQCSSEQTARYKAQLAQRVLKATPHSFSSSTLHSSPATLVDLTGGFGVDFSFMAQAFQKTVYVERQEHLCDIARHNFEVLGLKAEVVCGDSVDYLQQMAHASLIYLDPARRDNHGQRTYGISDCTPDVVALRALLLEKADVVIIKLSPMLDWRKAVSDLGEEYVREVHIISVQNECKELLLVLSARSSGDAEPLLFCVNDAMVFTSHLITLASDLRPQASSFFPLASQFLYEPNASIMKAGCFAEVAEVYGVSQLAPNSHLFVSDQIVADFPGRTFRVEAVTTMNKRELRTALAGISQANIAVRNFPLSVAQLRQRLKLGEGGSTYVFATTLADKSHVLLICRKTE